MDERPGIRVVLADDHQVVRQGNCTFLTAGGIDVVAEAQNGDEAISRIAELQPDVAVLDIQMPGCSGLEVARRVREMNLPVALLVLTAFDDDPFVMAALEAGVNGFVLKTADADEIVNAVYAVYEGESVLDKAVLGNVMRAVARSTHPHPESDELTDREIEVLSETARGLTNRAIGVKLHISDRTVQGHLRSIYEKLQVRNRTEAVVKAAQLDLLTLPEQH